jgi:hypothetical protein
MARIRARPSPRYTSLVSSPEPPKRAAELSADERRAARRTSLVFGKAKSFEELEELELDYWSRVSLSDKFQATIELVRDSWYLQGHDGPVPRLDRLSWGVRKLRG